MPLSVLPSLLLAGLSAVTAYDDSPARCVQVHHAEVVEMHEEGDVARGVIRAKLTKWSDMPGGKAWHEERNDAVTLRRENGEWKVTSRRAREEELADQLVALPHDQRLPLIEACPELQTPALVHALTMRAMELINQGKAGAARELLSLADLFAHDDAARAVMLAVRSSIETYPRNLDLAETALMLAERSGDPDALGWALLRFGRASAHTWWEPALPHFHRMLELAPYIENAAIPARAATQLSYYNDIYKRPREALRYAEIAMKYAARTSDPGAKMSALANVGSAYESQFDHELARPHYEAALPIARAAGYTAMTRDLLAHLATCHLALGDLDAAKAAIDEAISIASPSMLDALLLRRAEVHVARGDRAAAARDLQVAVEESYRHQKRPPIRPLRELAALLEAEGRHADALDVLREAACQADEYDLAFLRFPMARALRRLGRQEEAHALLLETLRQRTDANRPFGTGRDRSIGLDEWTPTYLELSDLLVDMGRPREAYLAAHQFRARTLLDAIVREQPPLTAIMTPAQLAEYRQREQRIVELNKAKNVGEELTAARLALADFSARVRGAHDVAFAAAAPPPPTELPNVPADVTVVEYVVTGERTIAFTLSGGHVGAHVIPLGEEALRKEVDRFVARIERRDHGYRPAARRLYDVLLAPVMKESAGKTLCIVPHRDLWRLPFHVLVTPDGKHVAETQSLFYAPGALMLSLETRRREPAAELLAIANPAVAEHTRSAYRARHRDASLGPLPEAEEEVRALARLYRKAESRIYVGEAAREAAFKREAGEYRVLHIATHGILDGRSPMFSSLLMAAGDDAEDGLLEAREIANMRLSADVAVLAACDTARGRISPGEGVIGMSWALLVAGCPNAVVSQWKADSAATSKLMVELHRQLVAGAALPAAMQAAQRSLLRQPRYAHPFYWAPFGVVGSGRR